jgi:hypothetical protein
MRHDTKAFFVQPTNQFRLLFTILLTCNSLFFLSSQGAFFPPLQNALPKEFFYLIYLIITLGGLLLLSKQKTMFTFDFAAKAFLYAYLPSEIIFLYALQGNFEVTPYVGLFAALYVALFALIITRHNLKKDALQNTVSPKTPLRRSHLATTIVLLVMAVSFSFGLFHLGKLAVVDEPLWTFDRIPNFWRDFGEMDWRNANVSDKPGQTVAAISGLGLLSQDNPKQFKNIIANTSNPNLNASKMETFNSAFRFPILVFVVAMLPFLYIFLRRLTGETSALLSVIFIALSPVILGNSRIINPDSILWIFTSLSIITFLLYLKEDKKADLLWSAFFLGLSLLTKYTGNLLYFFFLGLIFAEYIFNYARYAKNGFHTYFKKHLEDYFLLAFISMATFFVFYPAAWGKPMRLINSTLLSQAMEPVWPVLVAVLALLLLDILALKSAVTRAIVHFFLPLKKFLYALFVGTFLLSILLVFLNVYTGMAYFDFQDILSSPKSSFSSTTILAFFVTNFYPLVFGVSALALLPLLAFLFLSFKKNSFSPENSRVVFYLMLFILVYYAGSVASHVASIIRYQIIVFPILFIAAAIALRELLVAMPIPEKYRTRSLSLKKYAFLLALILFSAFSLWQVRPFYMGYASFLLPDTYYLDVKDMGEGSYEAAEYLNALPDAKKLVIWTDKQGVCVFFVGKCHTKIEAKFFADTQLDYLVVSSGRKSRTTKLRGELFIQGTSMKDIYETEGFEKLISIGNREANNVKIIKTTTLGN